MSIETKIQRFRDELEKKSFPTYRENMLAIALPLCAELIADYEDRHTLVVDNFIVGVRKEHAFQAQQWASGDDRRTAADWFWLVGYLAGKALTASIAGDVQKAKHHTISTAAALLHWHTALAKKTQPTQVSAEGAGQ